MPDNPEKPEITFSKQVATPGVLTVQCVAPDSKKTSVGGKILRSLIVGIFLLSIVGNVYFAIFLQKSFASPMSSTVLQKGDDDSIIAVYAVEGVISSTTASEFGQFYRMVRDNDKIKGVVIAVNSPGGAVTASDQIYSMIRSIREDLKRPVVISMDAVAASGGYYISVAGERIFAEPTAIVGSVGVIAQVPCVKGLADKIGVKVVIIRSEKSTRYKAKPDMYDLPDNETRLRLQKTLNLYHERFMKIVLESRPGIQKKIDELKLAKQVDIIDAAGKKKTITETRPLNAEVFLPDEALKYNLIDEIGGLGKAIAWLATKEKLRKPKVVQYSRLKTVMETMGMKSTGITIDKDFVQETLSPRIMMLWTAN